MPIFLNCDFPECIITKCIFSKCVFVKCIFVKCIFSCPQDSSIGDLVTHSLTEPLLFLTYKE